MRSELDFNFTAVFETALSEVLSPPTERSDWIGAELPPPSPFNVQECVMQSLAFPTPVCGSALFHEVNTAETIQAQILLL